MIKISKKPWKNMSMVTDAVMAGAAFSYLENNFKGIYENFISERDQILEKYENDKNWERFLELSIFQDLFIILGCAMIELWVNSFGIHLLNDEYYQKNIERLNIIEKIKILFAIHKREEIDENNENIKNIRKIFELRNRLVHPKAKRINENNFINFVFDPKKTDDSDYQFVKKTLKEVHKFFKDNDIIPIYINHIKDD